MLEELKRWLGRLFGSAPSVDGHGRATPSGSWEPGGGVSSFHLWWQGLEGPTPMVEVAATLEVVHRPVAERLYFWALQASFLDGGRTYGAGHIGLQWNQRHPSSTAVNWGGYADTGNVHSELKGSLSPLPSKPNDPNTRDYPWREGSRYRFRISRSEHGWRGEVTDLSGGGSGQPQHIRDLYAGGDRLGGFVVWSEVFAACDDPPASVRWTDLVAVDASGVAHRPNSVRLSFPSGGDCPNTEVVADAQGMLQLTNATRTARNGAVLPVPATPAL